MEDFGVATVPTHYLAVYPSAQRYSHGPAQRVSLKFSFRRDVHIYPFHSVVLAAHCSRLPPIPDSDPTFTVVEGEKTQISVKLPVIPLRVPRVQQFPVVMQYLYTYDWRQFTFNLIPVLPIPDLRDNDPIPSDPYTPFLHIHTLRHAINLVYVVPPKTLHAMREHMWGVYQNMVALGIADRKMWQVLIFCYDTTRLAEDLRRQRELLFKIAPPPDLSKGTLELKDGRLRYREVCTIKH